MDLAREVLKYLPAVGRDTYRDIPAKWFYYTEEEMRGHLNPSEQMSMIRTRFWDLVRERQLLHVDTEITIQELARGICSPQYVNNLLASQFRYVGWLMSPSPDYETRVSSLLDRGYDRVREIFDLPLYSEDGKVDTKTANLILSSVKMLDQRKHGAYLQRIEEKSLQVHTSVEEAKKNSLIGKALTVEELEHRIKELEGSVPLESLTHKVKDIIDVE